jgi:hypothetical protein
LIISLDLSLQMHFLAKIIHFYFSHGKNIAAPEK